MDPETIAQDLASIKESLALIVADLSQIKKALRIVEPKSQEPSTQEPTQASSSRSIPVVKKQPIELVDYSDRSFAVIGETRAYREDLKALGGRWNTGLDIGGVKMSGWIFSKNHLKEVEQLLGF